MRIPDLEYPCPYPIRVIGDNESDFPECIGEIVQKFDDSFDPKSIVVQPSKNGTFVSLRITFVAVSREQLDKLHQAIMATGRVKMVI